MISLDRSTPARSHRTALLAHAVAGKLLIHETYRSLQGESTFAGLPCVFVHLAVCNLRCSWCDTPHAFNRGEWQSVDAIYDRVRAFDTPLVEFTGGEPLLQPELLPLMTRLLDDGYTVLLETSGAEDVRPVDRRVHIIMDLKCPDSGECESNRWANLDALKPTDQIKFVLASVRDVQWMLDTVRKLNLDRRFTVLAGAVFGTVPLVELAESILASGRMIRMQLQQHKYIWGPDAISV